MSRAVDVSNVLTQCHFIVKRLLLLDAFLLVCELQQNVNTATELEEILYMYVDFILLYSYVTAASPSRLLAYCFTDVFAACLYTFCDAPEAESKLYLLLGWLPGF